MCSGVRARAPLSAVARLGQIDGAQHPRALAASLGAQSASIASVEIEEALPFDVRRSGHHPEGGQPMAFWISIAVKIWRASASTANALGKRYGIRGHSKYVDPRWAAPEFLCEETNGMEPVHISVPEAVAKHFEHHPVPRLAVALGVEWETVVEAIDQSTVRRHGAVLELLREIKVLAQPLPLDHRHEAALSVATSYLD